jgi:hypothetical protein
LIKPFWKQYYFQLKAHENGGCDPEVRSQQAYETVATVQCQGMKTNKRTYPVLVQKSMHLQSKKEKKIN